MQKSTTLYDLTEDRNTRYYLAVRAVYLAMNTPSMASVHFCASDAEKDVTVVMYTDILKPLYPDIVFNKGNNQFTLPNKSTIRVEATKHK